MSAGMEAGQIGTLAEWDAHRANADAPESFDEKPPAGWVPPWRNYLAPMLTRPPPGVELRGLSFSQALAHLKAGCRVARTGWNGKGMWIALTPGSEIAPAHARAGAAVHLADEHYRAARSQIEADLITIRPHIDMRAADGSLVIGWLPSPTDLLAEDWMVVG